MVDKKAIKRYRIRRDGRLEKRGIKFDFNDKHDKLGRFAPKSGGSTKPAEEMKSSDIKVKGPKETRQYIDSYLKKNPSARKQIESDAKKYSDALQRVKNFREEHPDAEMATYDIKTGKVKDVDDGYCVTFHQNYKIGDEFGAYDDKTYALMTAVAKHELGSEDVNIGFYGNPEISFVCKDYQHAKRYCVEHNQHSVYDARTHKLWLNDAWDEKYNPIKGEGSN